MAKYLVAAVLLAVGGAVSVPAQTIVLDDAAGWTGQPGYIARTQSFFLPLNAINVALAITDFSVDDRGILSLNNIAVDATGIFAGNGSVGSFNFGQAAPTVSYVFNAPGARNTIVTTGFVLGGDNDLTFQGNDTNSGIYGDVLATAANAGYTYMARVTYDLAAAVPEPATWLLAVTGFGAVGVAMRRRPRSLRPA